MISKELLETVLKLKIQSDFIVFNDRIDFVYDMDSTSFNKIINIHEFAHRCKVWASKQHYSVMSGWEMTHWGGAYHVVVYKNPSSILFSMSTIETEPEAIFKACEWILEKVKEKI